MSQASDKVAQILDVWRAGLGVVSLHVFQNVMACEAFTREACMIDALGELRDGHVVSVSQSSQSRLHLCRETR